MRKHARAARSLALVAALVLGAIPASAATLPVAAMNHLLGEKGQSLPGGVVRYSWLRTDLKVVAGNVEVRPALVLGSWASFMPTGGKDAIATGQLALRRNETRRVIATLDNSPFTITAVGDHLLGESPRLSYVHFVGRGEAVSLASSLRKALGATATPLKPVPEVIPAMPARWVDEIRTVLGYSGMYRNGVLSMAIARSEKVRMDGQVLPPPMGPESRFDFQSVGKGRVAAAGAIAVLENELPRVVFALSRARIEITALNGQLLGESPRLFYLHFFAIGTPEHLARSLRSAIARTGSGKEEQSWRAGRFRPRAADLLRRAPAPKG